jgi:hypothetical protein
MGWTRNTVGSGKETWRFPNYYSFRNYQFPCRTLYLSELHDGARRLRRKCSILRKLDCEDGMVWKWFGVLSNRYNYDNSGHYSSSLYLRLFRKLNSVSVFRWDLLNWAQWIEIVSVSGLSCLLGATEYVPPEDRDRILSPKRSILNKRQGDG